MATATRFDLTQVAESSSNVKTGMDPRLQLILSRRRAGKTKSISVSTDEDEVAVIARVTKHALWTSQGEVRAPIVLGETGSQDFIVTGRIPVNRIERVRELPFVRSLKAAQAVRPLLAATTVEIESQPHLLPAGHHTHGGSGVVVGVVDYGCDFVHQNFRRNDGKTRLLYLWDQNGGNSPTSPFGYGREHSGSELNLALAQANPYQAIGYDPADFDSGGGTHGTHVMDIAAGNGRGSGAPGVAPSADLIFVNITHDNDPAATSVVGESFGNSVTLLESLKYIFDKAGNRPTVVNVSLGTNGGPHDGSTLVEQGIDALVSAAPNRAVVFAAGNSFDDGIHAAGTIAPEEQIELKWNVAAQLSRDIELELWYTHADRFRVELVAPNGVLLASVGPGETKQVTNGNTIVALVANRLDDPNNHDNMIGVFLGAGMPGGDYVLRLQGETISHGGFHAWIERDNAAQSSFLPPHNNSHTIGSVSCGRKSIAVGSYDARQASRPLSFFSSAGPTRDGRKKPEISAPGQYVWAAKSGTGTGITRMSGTSMAAPAVAGVIALIFEEAAALGINLAIEQTIQLVEISARRNPPSGAAWHDRHGFGRISAAKAIAALANLQASPAAATVAKPAAKRKKKKKRN